MSGTLRVLYLCLWGVYLTAIGVSVIGIYRKVRCFGGYVAVGLDVKDIMQTIIKLKKEDKETLLFLLSRDGKELSKRYREVKSGKIKPLVREQVFKDV